MQKFARAAEISADFAGVYCFCVHIIVSSTTNIKRFSPYCSVLRKESATRQSY